MRIARKPAAILINECTSFYFWQGHSIKHKLSENKKHSYILYDIFLLCPITNYFK